MSPDDRIWMLVYLAIFGAMLLLVKFITATPTTRRVVCSVCDREQEIPVADGCDICVLCDCCGRSLTPDSPNYMM